MSNLISKNKEKQIARLRPKATRALRLTQLRKHAEWMEIPKGWESHPTCLIMIVILQSTEYREGNKTFISRINACVISFWEFLKKGVVPPDSGSEVLLSHYLFLEMRDKYTEHTLARSYHCLKSVLDRMITANPLIDEVIINDHANMPHIHVENDQSKPNLDMVQILPECEFENIELIDGLRESMTWFLQEMQRHRENIQKADPEIINAFDALNSKKHNPYEEPFYSKKKVISTDYPAFEWYERLMIAIMHQKDKGLVERYFILSKLDHLDLLEKENLSLGDMQDKLKRMFYQTRSVSKAPKKEQKKRRESIFSDPNFYESELFLGLKRKLPTFFANGLFNLVLPSGSEELAILYLFASDRIQTSGLERLMLSDCFYDNKMFQITNFDKFRSSQDNFPGPMYRNNSDFYEVAKNYIELKIKAKQYFGDYPRSDFIYSKPNIFGTPQLSGKTGFSEINIFQWFLNPCSTLNKKCRKERPTSIPFLDYIHRLRQHIKNTPANATARVLGLRFKAVTQSRWIVNEISKGSSSEVKANLSAHSVSVGKDVYLNRSQALEIIKNNGKFAGQVGDAMNKCAEKLREALSAVKLATVVEIEELLGMKVHNKQLSEDDLFSMLANAHEKDFVVQLYGEMKSSSKTYIITSELTSALIQGYIKHIESYMTKLANDNPPKVKVWGYQLLYLELVLEQFPANLLKAGKQLMSEVNFPYPPLT